MNSCHESHCVTLTPESLVNLFANFNDFREVGRLRGFYASRLASIRMERLCLIRTLGTASAFIGTELR